MQEEFVEAIDRAISQLITDFQGQSNRFWNERDIHWYLFHYLKQDRVFLHDYGIELIRAEFPTRAMYREEKQKTPSRRQYDLVVLDPTSLTSSPINELPPWASWEECLPYMRLLVAVEVKTWVDRTTDIAGKVDRDIEKLTDPQNAVGHARFLNFVQLDFRLQQMRDFYQSLREYLMEKARSYTGLRILCVPYDKEIQPDPGQNWIH
jgi:hypothetical protein